MVQVYIYIFQRMQQMEDIREIMKEEVELVIDIDHRIPAVMNSDVGKIKKIIKAKEKVPCTGCRYCMPCPRGVDIPGNFHCYNLMSTDGKFEGWRNYFQSMCLRDNPGMATLCIACGKCEAHCPQHINIIEELKKADRALRPAYFRPVMYAARKVVARRRKK